MNFTLHQFYNCSEIYQKKKKIASEYIYNYYKILTKFYNLIIATNRNASDLVRKNFNTVSF